ncbi:hypothetical protein BDZ89DRAFT_1144892 [Hymenopellis radicata]|nr:hypothetical protein BDZ89DRAFT_1144892 [Hymenopellis radicata]
MSTARDPQALNSSRSAVRIWRRPEKSVQGYTHSVPRDLRSECWRRRGAEDEQIHVERRHIFHARLVLQDVDTGRERPAARARVAQFIQNRVLISKRQECEARDKEGGPSDASAPSAPLATTNSTTINLGSRRTELLDLNSVGGLAGQAWIWGEKTCFEYVRNFGIHRGGFATAWTG